jgi:hypothetical protein
MVFEIPAAHRDMLHAGRPTRDPMRGQLFQWSAAVCGAPAAARGNKGGKLSFGAPCHAYVLRCSCVWRTTRGSPHPGSIAPGLSGSRLATRCGWVFDHSRTPDCAFGLRRPSPLASLVPHGHTVPTCVNGSGRGPKSLKPSSSTSDSNKAAASGPLCSGPPSSRLPKFPSRGQDPPLPHEMSGSRLATRCGWVFDHSRAPGCAFGSHQPCPLASLVPHGHTVPTCANGSERGPKP